MTEKKPAGAKKAPVKVDSLTVRRTFAPLVSAKWDEAAQQWYTKIEEIADRPAGHEPAADGSEDMQRAIDASVDLLRHYARLADAKAPNLHKIGMAGLRRLAAQLLEADPAVRALRAMGGDERVHHLAEYAKEVGYPAKCERKAFILSAAEKFQVDARTIERWLAKATKGNLLT